MDTLVRDISYALRTLRKQRAFTITAVLTLGLAIAAATTIFSVVQSALLHTLPFRSADRLVFVWGVAGPERAIRGASLIEAQDWARLSGSFEHFAIYDETSLNLQTDQGAERIDAEMVSASYWPMLGVGAQVGRTFTAEEDRTPNTHPVVTISDRMWRGRYGSDPGIVGREITLNDRAFTVVGVMPAGFAGISFDTDVWFPAMMVQINGVADLTARGTRWLASVARLKPGVTLEQAQGDVDRVAAALAREHPESNTDRGVQLVSLRESYLGPTENLLLVVFAAVALLLLIAIANVLGLQFVRAAGRSREISVRLAIGAGWARLMRQLVVEGLTLSVLAACVGVIAAYWGLAGFLAVQPDGVLPPYATPAINLPTLAFVLGVTVASGITFGLIPAWRSSRADLASSLKAGTRSSSGGIGAPRAGAQQLLVIGQTAVALVLLVGAGLFVRSLQRELRVDPGFVARDVLRARVTVPQHYTAAMRRQFAEQFDERLRAIPSVGAVALGSDMPLGGSSSAAFLFVPGHDERVRFYRHSVSPDFFIALGIQVVSGRAFTGSDRDGTPPVVLVNESMARRFWADESPLGQRIRLGSETGPEVTVVGVVGDVRYRDLRTSLATSEPDVYFPMAQRPVGALQIGVRSSLPPDQVTGAVRAVLSRMDPRITLFGARPLDDILMQQTANGRLASSVLTTFGLAALVLTAVGVYGLLAFLVTLRSREIGIRLALGASSALVRRGVVGHGVRLVVIGLTLGLCLAAVATRLVATQLFGVDAHDPLVFATVPLVLLAVALVASWAPARRATNIDPQTALRAD